MPKASCDGARDAAALRGGLDEQSVRGLRLLFTSSGACPIANDRLATSNMGRSLIQSPTQTVFADGDALVLGDPANGRPLRVPLAAPGHHDGPQPRVRDPAESGKRATKSGAPEASRARFQRPAPRPANRARRPRRPRSRRFGHVPKRRARRHAAGDANVARPQGFTSRRNGHTGCRTSRARSRPWQKDERGRARSPLPARRRRAIAMGAPGDLVMQERRVIERLDDVATIRAADRAPEPEDSGRRAGSRVKAPGDDADRNAPGQRGPNGSDVAVMGLAARVEQRAIEVDCQEMLGAFGHGPETSGGRMCQASWRKPTTFRCERACASSHRISTAIAPTRTA